MQQFSAEQMIKAFSQNVVTHRVPEIHNYQWTEMAFRSEGILENGSVEGLPIKSASSINL